MNVYGRTLSTRARRVAWLLAALLSGVALVHLAREPRSPDRIDFDSIGGAAPAVRSEPSRPDPDASSPATGDRSRPPESVGGPDAPATDRGATTAPRRAEDPLPDPDLLEARIRLAAVDLDWSRANHLLVQLRAIPDSRARIEALLQAPPARLQTLVLNALVRRPGTGVPTETIVRLAGLDPSPEVRGTALTAAHRLADDPAKAIEATRRALTSDPHPSVRSTAARLLGPIDDPSIGRDLVRSFLTEKERTVLLATANALRKRARVEEARPILESLQAGGRIDLGMKAEGLDSFRIVQAWPIVLAGLPPEESLPILRQAASSAASDPTRRRLAQLYGTVGHPAAGSDLIDLYHSTQDALVRTLALQGIGRIPGSRFEDFLAREAESAPNESHRRLARSLLSPR